MDVFGDFDSEYSERFPSTLELKKTKQMLLSGDKDQILQSVEYIKHFSQCEESLSEIIRSDIPEFLCDAVVPFDSDLVSELYSCLEILSGHVEFFTHNHSSFAIESLLRTLHFVLKDINLSISLNQCLNLLNIIVQGYNNHGVVPEKKTIENLLQLLPNLNKNLTPTINNKYHIGVFIMNLLELNILKHSEESHEIILVNFSIWYNLLNEILESEHPMREQLILLSCMLSHSVLRYFISKKNFSDNEFEINEDLKNDLLNNIIEFLISVGAPYVDNVPLRNIENDFSHVENFYQTILCFYSDEITKEKNRLTHGLSEKGFFQFTTRIISNVDFSRGQKLKKLCLLILFHMIIHLSEDIFHFPDLWPKGRDDFRSEIQKGIAQLPLNPSQWLDLLLAPHAPPSSKMAVLLYLYFYAMTAKSEEMLIGIYPSIVSFIRITKGIESSILLLKLLWFIFVMCELSLNGRESLDNSLEATEEMVSLLEKEEKNFSLIYTHHPSFLYWAFSSRVTTQIQIKIVHLWLRNKSSDCKELEELIGKCSDVRFALLEIIENGCGQELDSAFSCLKSFLPESEELSESVWFLLPKVLAKFTTDSISAINVDYVIELCSMKTPKNLEVSKIIRIAFLFPKVFLKSDLISFIPSLSLTFQILQITNQTEDNRVLLIFLRHNGYIEKILEGINSNISEISFLTLKIINILWEKCKELKSSEIRKRIKINKKTILKILENSNSENVLFESLNFLSKILISNFESEIFFISNIDFGFLEILFLQILNICIQGTSEICEKCWQCLNLFLTAKFPQIEGETNDFSSHPLLHELILSSLSSSSSPPPSLTQKESPMFKQFLSTFIHLNNFKLNESCFERKLFGKFFSQTLDKLKKTFKSENNLFQEVKNEEEIN